MRVGKCVSESLPARQVSALETWWQKKHNNKGPKTLRNHEVIHAKLNLSHLEIFNVADIQL
jgi:hypothetical protein